MVDRLHRITELIQKSWAGVLTEREKEELVDQLRNENLQQIYGNLNKENWIEQKLNEYDQFQAKPAFHQFCKLNHQSKGRSLWKYLSVVAAILVVLVGTTLLLNQHREKTEVTEIADACLINPGSHKAILHLSDGSSVRIEGQVEQIRETKAGKIRYADGAISYDSDKKVEGLVYNELVVPVTGECYITLEDGTRVWINADSKLKYPIKFIGSERKVYLEGEAFFEVSKNGKPFIVNTSMGDIRVLGTTFNVKVYKSDEQLCATLVMGKISFQNTTLVELEPGEQVVVAKNGSIIKREVEVEEYVSWKDGLYVFKERRLEDIMDELARWYGIQVFFRQPELKDMQFSGNLKRYDHVNVLMELLRTTQELKYSISGNTIILYK